VDIARVVRESEVSEGVSPDLNA